MVEELGVSGAVAVEELCDWDGLKKGSGDECEGVEGEHTRNGRTDAHAANDVGPPCIAALRSRINRWS
ncbi:hypothetical protein CJ178_30180 [Rhodococcus sp. ACPA4]|nr:hypothetical protein CJ178_30180 [Rhodococcus sp. ACPA4]